MIVEALGGKCDNISVAPAAHSNELLIFYPVASNISDIFFRHRFFMERSEPPSKRSKRAAATNTEIKLEILGLTERVEALSERVESLTAAGRRREKAFAAREKTAAVTRMMEANRMQVS